jgi:hypothetical protein
VFDIDCDRFDPKEELSCIFALKCGSLTLVLSTRDWTILSPYHHIQVLYTHQKLKKSKTWQDGVLRLNDDETRASLYSYGGSITCASSAAGSTNSANYLDSIFIRNQVRNCYHRYFSICQGIFNDYQLSVGDELEFEKYLVTVEEEQQSDVKSSAKAINSRPTSSQEDYSIKRLKTLSIPDRKPVLPPFTSTSTVTSSSFSSTSSNTNVTSKSFATQPTLSGSNSRSSERIFRDFSTTANNWSHQQNSSNDIDLQNNFNPGLQPSSAFDLYDDHEHKDENSDFLNEMDGVFDDEDAFVQEEVSTSTFDVNPKDHSLDWKLNQFVPIAIPVVAEETFVKVSTEFFDVESFMPSKTNTRHQSPAAPPSVSLTAAASRPLGLRRLRPSISTAAKSVHIHRDELLQPGAMACLTTRTPTFATTELYRAEPTRVLPALASQRMLQEEPRGPDVSRHRHEIDRPLTINMGHDNINAASNSTKQSIPTTKFKLEQGLPFL